jgi:hypothetical protein
MIGGLLPPIKYLSQGESPEGADPTAPGFAYA